MSRKGGHAMPRGYAAALSSFRPGTGTAAVQQAPPSLESCERRAAAAAMLCAAPRRAFSRRQGRCTNGGQRRSHHACGSYNGRHPNRMTEHHGAAASSIGPAGAPGVSKTVQKGPRRENPQPARQLIPLGFILGSLSSRAIGDQTQPPPDSQPSDAGPAPQHHAVRCARACPCTPPCPPQNRWAWPQAPGQQSCPAQAAVCRAAARGAGC